MTIVAYRLVRVITNLSYLLVIGQALLTIGSWMFLINLNMYIHPTVNHDWIVIQP